MSLICLAVLSRNLSTPGGSDSTSVINGGKIVAVSLPRGSKETASDLIRVRGLKIECQHVSVQARYRPAFPRDYYLLKYLSPPAELSLHQGL